MSDSLWNKFNDIRGFIFDVDGVFTDGQLLVTENGQLLRRMHVHDGHAVKRALKSGFHVGIITGGSSEGVRIRLQNLGIQHITMRCGDKAPALQSMLSEMGITAEEVSYMGDDEPDIACLHEVGIPCAPRNAIPDVLAAARYISTQDGGRGCVRDLIEKVMRAQGKW